MGIETQAARQAACARSGPIRLIWSTEPFGGKRTWVGKRRLAGHHLREQATGSRTERQAVVLVAEIEPKARVARRLADDGQHVWQTGTRAHPRFSIDRLAQRKQRTRARQR